jgi:hypothetical protein
MPVRSVSLASLLMVPTAHGSWYRSIAARSMPHVKPFIATVLSVFVAAQGMAQEHPHGHGGRMGEVRFATSCGEPAQRIPELTEARDALATRTI